MRRTHQIDSALLVLRVVTGVTMYMHGWQKYTDAGFAGVGDMFAGMDVPLASVAGPVVLGFELVGGPLLVIGAATRAFASAFVVVMLGALFTVHLSAGFYVADGGYELVLLLAAANAALAIAGPGVWSADELFARRAARHRRRMDEHEREDAVA